MAMGNLSIKMEYAMKAILRMIAYLVMELCSLGQIDLLTQDNGTTTDLMALACFSMSIQFLC